MRTLALLAIATLLHGIAHAAPAPDDGKLRIIVFGAHPDDAQYKAGGTAAKWVKAGCPVETIATFLQEIG
jgi:hypothetical protein